MSSITRRSYWKNRRSTFLTIPRQASWFGGSATQLGRDAEYIVFGVVTEYCVRCAAKGLLERGCKVAVVEDAIETLKPEEGRRTLEELTRLGARLITTDEAVQMAAAAGAQKVI